MITTAASSLDMCLITSDKIAEMPLLTVRLSTSLITVVVDTEFGALV